MGNSKSTARDLADFIPARFVNGPPLEYYYTVVLALMRGSKQNHRPRLPSELVILICRFANFRYLNPAPAFIEDRGASVTAFGSEVESKIWMQIPLSSTRTLKHIHSFQLFTSSKHQGWVSDPSAGSWSWFEVGIYRKDESSGQLVPKTQSDGSLAFWVSHTHPVDDEDEGGSIDYVSEGEGVEGNEGEGEDEDEIGFDDLAINATNNSSVVSSEGEEPEDVNHDDAGEVDEDEVLDEVQFLAEEEDLDGNVDLFVDENLGEDEGLDINDAGSDGENDVYFADCRVYEGMQFGPEHPIWDHVEEGDILVVELKAQFPGWANYANRGVIFVNNWWEPSAAMLELARIG
ncbi:hypothetical protein FRC12_014097 [Ceratobasidium sp. 428]|nr:hypothetical protein FRC12_014097 [Ceratobasidium sp. 428]